MVLPNTQLNVLIVEDFEDDALLIVQELQRGGYQPKWLRVDTPEAMEEALHGQTWDVVLSDFKMPHFNAQEALKLLQSTDLDIPFIAISGAVGEEAAVELMRKGAADFLLKDSLARLVPAVQREIKATESQQLIQDESQIIMRIAEHAGRITTAGNWERNLESNQILWSESMYHIFDLTPGSVVTYDLLRSIIHPNDVDLWEIELAKMVQKSNGPFHLNYRIVKPDGSVSYIYTVAEVLRRRDGKLLKIIGMSQDVTIRRQEKEKLHHLFEKSPVGIATCDLQGKFLIANPTLQRMYGYSMEELKDLTFFDITHPDYIDRNKKLIQTISSGETTKFVFDKKYICKDGSEIFAEIHSSVISDEEGKPQYMTAFVIDITNRKSLETQLIQAQKMESIGRLAGGVAHDFNNTLSVIIGYSESSLKSLGPENPLYEDIAEILDAGKRSADITRQLLAFARKQTTIPQIIDLNSNIEGLLKMLRRLIGENIDLAWLPGLDLWPLKIDPAQIDQILANLCVNARDAIADVGKVTIETKNIQIHNDLLTTHAYFTPGEFVMLTVSDDGRGMAQEVIDNIFEPFFTTKGIGEGTGLGLATVYGIIKQNNGFINVYSEIDNGTTFRCYFPVHSKEDMNKVRKIENATPTGHGETILLVEDDPSIIKLCKVMLVKMGYNVLPASSPAKAIELAKEKGKDLDLLLTDVIMPAMNGRDLSEKLQTIVPGIKTLFMSGYTADIITDRGILDQGILFISKPLSRRELAVKVREVLDSTGKP